MRRLAPGLRWLATTCLLGGVIAVAAVRASPSAPATKLSCFGAAALDPRHPCSDPRLSLTVVPAPRDAPLTHSPPCGGLERSGELEVCFFGAPRAAASASLALVGDSHAWQWRGAFEPMARSRGWVAAQITRSSCPFSFAVPALPAPERTSCTAWNRQVRQWLAAHPGVSTIFVAQSSAGRVLTRHGRDERAERIDGFVGAWSALPISVRHLVVLRDTPFMRANTPECVQRAIARHRRPGPVCALPRSHALSPDVALDAARRTTGRSVQTVDLTGFQCDAWSCFPVVGGALVYLDYQHFTWTYATTLAPYLGARVDNLRTAWR